MYARERMDSLSRLEPPATHPDRSAIRGRNKLGHDVTRYLRDALTSGVFRPGQRMAVQELAKHLDVSTMPVREALITLANEGLLDVLPRRGFRVASRRVRDIEDVFRIHAFVAGLLAQEAAHSITSDQLSRLREIQQAIELHADRHYTAEESSEVEKLNFEFHRIINWASDSPRLRWFLRAASEFVPRYFYASIPGWVDATVHSHPPILRALEKRDGARARRLMEQHVTRAGRLVKKNLSHAGDSVKTVALTSGQGAGREARAS